MTASDAEDDIITLVTSNDPPFELPVERELLRDSRVFSDMFSLPTTSDGDARLNVAETAYELGLWIDFLRSGQVETPDPDAWDHDTDQEVGQDVVRIAKLVDKYVCTSSRHLFVNELWRLLAEGGTHPFFIVLASDHIQADHVQRHAAAETLARRAREGTVWEKQYIRSDVDFEQWEARMSEWQGRLAPVRSLLIVKRSQWFGSGDSCGECNPTKGDLWREILLATGRDQNPIDSFARTLQSYPKPPRHICLSHRSEFFEVLHELDSQLRRRLPPLPPRFTTPHLSVIS